MTTYEGQVPGALHDLDSWEARWAPYDEASYTAVLAAIQPDDVVLDIGAGDLRLARRMAKRAGQVIAWEMQPELLAAAVHGSVASSSLVARSGRFPEPASEGLLHEERLVAVCTDARIQPIPPNVTVAVLLMRHCTHFALYVAKLRAAGCQRLITNARWGMDVEVIDLAPAAACEAFTSGWYACRRCGATGWVGEDPATINAATLETVTDVEGCPVCLVNGKR